MFIGVARAEAPFVKASCPNIGRRRDDQADRVIRQGYLACIRSEKQIEWPVHPGFSIELAFDSDPVNSQRGPAIRARCAYPGRFMRRSRRLNRDSEFRGSKLGSTLTKPSHLSCSSS